MLLVSLLMIFFPDELFKKLLIALSTVSSYYRLGERPLFTTQFSITFIVTHLLKDIKKISFISHLFIIIL